MLQTCLFWALLLLPGLALVRAFAAQELERGLLSGVALGYAGSFCLLSPASVLCYALGLPLWVFSTATAICIGLGLLALLRSGAFWALGRLWAQELPLPALLLVALLVLDARAGGWLDGDATYHVGRIRDLLDHGFNNRDIYLKQPYFAYAYHTNLLHGLYAAAAQLTRQDPLLVWFASLPWAKLVIAGGHYQLGHVLVQKRWAAWLVALIASIACAGETYAIYPNLLAVGWLVPLVLAAGFCAHESDVRRTRTLTSLSLGSLLLAEVHALYWVFASIALAPLLAARAIFALKGQPRRAVFYAACLLALLAALPWLLIARYAGQPSAAEVQTTLAISSGLPPLPVPAAERASSSPAEPKPSEPQSPALRMGGGHLEKQLVRDAAGDRALPLSSAGGWAFVIFGIAALGYCLWRPEPLRPRMLALAAAIIPFVAIPLNPSLCALVISHGLPDFGVARMVTLASSLFFVAIGAAIAALVDRFLAGNAWRNAVLALSALCATQLLGHAPRSFSEHVASALAPAAQRHSLLEQHFARRALLKTHIPAGETVLATLRDARYVVMLHDLHVVAADRGHGRAPDVQLRRRHVEWMTEAHLAWPLRAQLLSHYGLHFVIYRDKHQARFAWALQHGEYLGHAGGWHLVKLEDRLPGAPAAVL